MVVANRLPSLEVSYRCRSYYSRVDAEGQFAVDVHGPAMHGQIATQTTMLRQIQSCWK